MQYNIVESYVNGLNLVLADTPGFEDTNRADSRHHRRMAREYVKIPRGLPRIQGAVSSKILENSYRNKIRLTGILYLHRITDNRVGGASLKDLRMFGELCGDLAMSRVTLVTTMWDRIQDCEVGESRERELKGHFWNIMLDNGSKVARFSNDFVSAKKIVNMLIGEGGTVNPPTARGVRRRKKCLNETSAGRMLYNDLRQLLDEQKVLIQKLVDQSNKHSNPHLFASLPKEWKWQKKSLVLSWTESSG